MKSSRMLGLLTVAALLFVAATFAGKARGGKPKPNPGPPNPVFVFPTLSGMDAMNEDFSNQTTVWLDEFGGHTGGEWIPGRNWIFFAEYLRTVEAPVPEAHLFQRVEISIVDGEVVGGPPVAIFESSPDTYKPSWHWGSNGGEILFYRALNGGYALEIVELGLCTENCTPGASEVLYQSPVGYGLNWPIRSADGTRVWAIEYQEGEPYLERIIEIDLTDNNRYSIFKHLVGAADGRGSRLAPARTFEGFAYRDGADVYIHDAETGGDTFVTSDANPLTFSPDDKVLVVSKYGRNRVATDFVHWTETPVSEETIANWTASLDWKH